MTYFGVFFITMCHIQICGVQGLQVSSNNAPAFDFDPETLARTKSGGLYDESLDALRAHTVYGGDTVDTGEDDTSGEQLGFYWKTLTHRIFHHHNRGTLPLFQSHEGGVSKLSHLRTIMNLLEEMDAESPGLRPEKPPSVQAGGVDGSDPYKSMSEILHNRQVDSNTHYPPRELYRNKSNSPPNTESVENSQHDDDMQTPQWEGLLKGLRDVMGSHTKSAEGLNEASNSKLHTHWLQQLHKKAETVTSDKRGVLDNYPQSVSLDAENTQDEEPVLDNEMSSSYDYLDYSNDTTYMLLNETLSNKSESVVKDSDSQIPNNADTDTNSTSIVHSVASHSELITDNHSHVTASTNGSNSDDITQGAKALELEPRSPTTTATPPTTKQTSYYIEDLVDNGQPVEFYRDVCQSLNRFEIISTAINDHLQNVEVLPNTWVWSSKCVSPNKACTAIGPGVKALCKQKKGWVQAFARLHSRDPWRWHWIAVDSGCSCGVKIGR